MDGDGKVIKVAYEQRSIGDLGTGDRGAKRHTTMPVTEDDMVELYNERKDRQLVKDSSRECAPRSPLDLDRPSSSRSAQISSDQPAAPPEPKDILRPLTRSCVPPRTPWSRLGPGRAAGVLRVRPRRGGGRRVGQRDRAVRRRQLRRRLPPGARAPTYSASLPPSLPPSLPRSLAPSLARCCMPRDAPPHPSPWSPRMSVARARHSRHMHVATCHAQRGNRSIARFPLSVPCAGMPDAAAAVAGA